MRLGAVRGRLGVGAVGGVLEGDAVADDLGKQGVALGGDFAGTFPARGAVLFGLFVVFDGFGDGGEVVGVPLRCFYLAAFCTLSSRWVSSLREMRASAVPSRVSRALELS